MELFEALGEARCVQPTFITDFPSELSPLAKARPDDPRYVQRFELYIAGMEVANAYSELNDPREQRRRFEAQVRAARPATRKPSTWTRIPACAGVRAAAHGRGRRGR